MSNQIEIKIDAKKLTPEKFLEAATSFFGLVQGVAKNVVTLPVHWTVEVDKGSAIVRVRAENPTSDSEQCIETVSRGICSLRTGIHIVPYGFTKDEVRAAKTLAELTDGVDIQGVFIKNGKLPECLTPDVIKSADIILKTESSIAFGSIEGKVVNISLRQAFCCTIREPLYRKEVLCYLQDSKAQEDALESVKMKARVLVSGLIHYAKDGYPHSITADKVEVFPPQSDLPTLREIQNIYKLYK